MDQNHDHDEQPRHRGVLIGMCIVFSILLWFFSSMGETYTRRIDLVSSVENISGEEAFLRLPPSSVTAQVKGEGLQLMQLYYNPPRIVIDASGEVVNFRDAVMRQLPPGVNLEQVIPGEFALSKETRITKKVPVLPRTSISWPSTHDLIQPPRVFPDSVEVSGAKSIVESLTGWPTVAFEEDDLKDTLNVSLLLADSLEGLIQLERNDVEFTAIVEEFTEGSRELDIMVTEVPSNQSSVSLDPPVVEVLFRVPLSHYQQAMKARDFFALIPYDKLRDDTTGFVVPNIELPQGILFMDMYLNPPEIRYYDLLIDE